MKDQFRPGQEAFKVLNESSISEDEKNILMYACGYIPVSLIHKYEKRQDQSMLYLSSVQKRLQLWAKSLSIVLRASTLLPNTWSSVQQSGDIMKCFWLTIEVMALLRASNSPLSEPSCSFDSAIISMGNWKRDTDQIDHPMNIIPFPIPFCTLVSVTWYWLDQQN